MVKIRPVAGEDEARLSLRLFNDTRPDYPVTWEEHSAYVALMGEHGDFIAWLDGEPVGSAVIGIEPWRPNLVARMFLAVPPPFRRRGVGTALWHAVSRWAEPRGREALEDWVREVDPDGADWARKRGFVEVVREQLVALDLAAFEPPRVEPPPGIEIVAWAERPELASGMYEVAREAMPDIPGQEDEEVEAFEDWLAHDMQSTGDRPEATFVALAGDEVVGYAKFHFWQARPTVVAHDLTGVKRAWRGRGIARALKAHQIRWAKEHGYERLETANEVRNAPIRHLNEQFGYRPIPGRTLVRGPLAPPQER